MDEPPIYCARCWGTARRVEAYRAIAFTLSANLVCCTAPGLPIEGV